MHAHFYGEALFARLAGRTGVPRVETDDGRRFMVTPTSRFELRGGFLSVQARLDYMNEVGIDRQLITFPGALGAEVLPLAEAVPLVREVNDELSETCRAHPRRFAALCGLPLADIDAAIGELERACRLFGVVGAILPWQIIFPASRGSNAALRCSPPATRWARISCCIPGPRHDEPMTPKQDQDLGMHRASTIDLHAGIAHALLTLIHSDVRRVSEPRMAGGGCIHADALQREAKAPCAFLGGPCAVDGRGAEGAVDQFFDGPDLLHVRIGQNRLAHFQPLMRARVMAEQIGPRPDHRQ